MGQAHRPINSIVQNNTTRVEKLDNRSGKYRVTCNHCDVDAFIHRDNAVLNHLQICPGASQDLKNSVLRALMEKGHVENTPTVVTIDSDAENQPSSRNPAATNGGTSRKKRKTNHGITKYMIPSLTEKEENEANTTLLR